MNQLEACLGKWDTEAMEKVLVGYLNQVLASQSVPGLSQKKAITTKDFLCLSPGQFKEIVSLIVNNNTSPQELRTVLEKRGSEREKLSSFNALNKEFSVSFDPEPVIFYKELKKLFPADLDLLRPSVILNPSGDPQRTRKVLRYLIGLMVFVDGRSEGFENVYEEVSREVNEWNDLVKRLDELKSEINKRMIEQDTWKMEVGTLKKESQVKKEEIEVLEKNTAELEERVQKASITYNELQEQKNAASRELEGVVREIEDTSKLLVNSPERILESLKSEKEKLQQLNQHRDYCSQKLQESSNENSRVATVTEEANKTISFFHDLVLQMQEANEAKNAWTESQACVPQKLQLIEELKQKIENIGNSLPGSSVGQLSLLTKTLERLETHYTEKSNICSELTEDLKNLKLQLEGISAQIVTQRNKAVELETTVKEYEDYILVELPQTRAAMEELIVDTLDALDHEFKLNML
ncbi:unnamed protein product [Allacma fusca]|uniref:Uncharacterized protein n=1 Tax=Allacma fusca TaxID=39272 RepID=A0A8J2NXA8_9HEXA|nr:unnamed protein product [Allacma fusca]